MPFGALAQSPMFVDSVRCSYIWPDLREYALTFLPANYRPSERFPLILFFHGDGETGSTKEDLAKIFQNASSGGPAYFIAHDLWPDSFYSYKDDKYYEPIVISPQSASWSTDYKVVGVIIKELLARYSIDTSRIYLMGLSAGGWTIWNYSAHYHQLPPYPAAAIVPMSMATNASSMDASYIVSDSVRVWGFGDVSGDVWGLQTRKGLSYLNRLVPGIARFTDTRGSGHGGWENYYDPKYREYIGGHNVNIYEWMLYWKRGGGNSVIRGNISPIVSAGMDMVQFYPNAVSSLSGSATDDHGNVSHYWSVVSSPPGSHPIILDSSAFETSVSGLDVIGSYSFRLTVTDDSGSTSMDEMTIDISKPETIGPHDRVIWPDHYSGVDLDGRIYNPGDTIYFGPMTYEYIRVSNLVGSPDKPIVIMPLHAPVMISERKEGGICGLFIKNCRYIHIDGSLRDGGYGFHLIGTPFRWPQCFVYGRSKNIEINNIYGYKVNYGFQIKNDPTCDVSTWNDDEARSFVMDSITLHDFHFDSTTYEGTYIGGTLNTSTNSYGLHGGYRVVCGRDTSYHFQYRMGNITIYNGLIENTGDDGIQLVDVRFGKVDIHDVRLLNIGARSGSYQNHGMSLGGYMQADIHDNYIHNAGTGIFLNGQGDITIRDDTIINIFNNDGLYLANNVDTLYKTLSADSMVLRIHNNIIDSTNWAINLTNYNHILQYAQLWDNTVTHFRKGKLNNNNDGSIKWQGQFNGAILDTSAGSHPFCLITSVDTGAGSITIHAISSGLPIEYSVDGNTWQADSIFTGLDNGWYIVSAKISAATRDNRNQIYVDGGKSFHE